MTHYEEMYKKLLVTHEDTVKKIDDIQNKLFDVLSMAKISADSYEFNLRVLEKENETLEEENKKLKEQIKSKCN